MTRLNDFLTLYKVTYIRHEALIRIYPASTACKPRLPIKLTRVQTSRTKKFSACLLLFAAAVQAATKDTDSRATSGSFLQHIARGDVSWGHFSDAPWHLPSRNLPRPADTGEQRTARGVSCTRSRDLQNSVQLPGLTALMRCLQASQRQKAFCLARRKVASDTYYVVWYFESIVWMTKRKCGVDIFILIKE